MMLKNSLAFFALTLAALGAAQNVPPTVSVKLDKKPIVAGQPYTVTVVAKFAEGLHVYQNPPTDKFEIPVEIKATDGTKISKVTYPKGVLKKTAGSEKPSAVYEGEVTFVVTLIAPKKAGDAKVKLEFNYQQCTSDNCYPPAVVPAVAAIKVLKK